MARAFITGGGGFLASHLATALLEKGHKVSLLSRRASPPGLPEGAGVVRGDLLSGRRALIPRDAEVVYHLAAKSSVIESTAGPRATYEVNVMGTARLLDEVRTRGLALRRFVLASTGLVYGPPLAGRIREDHPLLPRNVYSASKVACEHYAVACADLYGVPVSIVRLFNVYGPGQRPEFVIPSVLSQCLSGREIRIGNPWPVRDFLHVDDAVRLFEAAAKKARSRREVVNAGSGRGIAIHELVKAAQRATGTHLNVRSEAGRSRPNDVNRLVADISKAKRLFGWTPRVGLAEGLQRTAAWMAEQGPPSR